MIFAINFTPEQSLEEVFIDQEKLDRKSDEAFGWRVTMTVFGLLFIALDVLVVYARFQKNRIEEENKIAVKDRISMFWFILEVVIDMGPCFGLEESENTKNYKERASINSQAIENQVTD